MKYNRIFLFIILSFFLLSCNNKKEEYSTDAPNRGEITIHYDDSFSNVAEALTYRYMKFYPETKINLQISKEDKALEDLLNHKVRLIIMSRELTETERRLYDSKIKLKWQPAYFAADAVCFVVNKNSSLSSVSLAEIKQMLSSKERKLIFDGSNTSNLNAIVQKLQLDPKKIEYSVIKGNENIIKNLEKFPNHIGVISFNTISRPFGEKAIQLRESIKILPMKVGEEDVLPTKENLKTQKYPLTKILYFLTNEPYFGLGNGLIRFSCTQIGQLIVDKQGLQPFYIFPRTVEMR
jgi:phosphate transport system substrate-binding protein